MIVPIRISIRASQLQTMSTEALRSSIHAPIGNIGRPLCGTSIIYDHACLIQVFLFGKDGVQLIGKI